MRKLILALALSVASAFAQNTLQTATLTAALPAQQLTGSVPMQPGGQIIAVSAAPTLAVPFIGFVDQEAFMVTAVNSTAVTITIGSRGWDGTRVSGHLANATVYFGLPDWFSDEARVTVGSCTSPIYASPRINLTLGTLTVCNNGQFQSQAIGGFSRSAVFSRVAVADVNYTAKPWDDVIAYATLTAGRTVTLPAANTLPIGKFFTIKDEAGAAGAQNITISPNVDGGSKVISANFGTYCVYTNGTAYFSCAKPN